MNDVDYEIWNISCDDSSPYETVYQSDYEHEGDVKQFAKTHALVIPIEIHRKRIKNMYLHIEPGGRVIVSAPVRFSDTVIRSFIQEKKNWLIKQQLRMAKARPLKELSFETGDTVYYKGKPLTLRLIPDRSKSLTIGENSVILCIHPQSSVQERETFYKFQMKLRLLRILSERVSYWESQMGLKCSSFNVRDMKSRWGSCNVETKKLTFNLHLIEAYPVCTDYVVIHELAHIRYPSHDKDFWAFVGQFMPDYKTVRKQLNEPGHEEPLVFNQSS